MPMFRKKPVVIEAVQIDKRMDLTSPAWWAEAIQQCRVSLHGMGKFTRDLPMVEVVTLEGIMTGVQGDWIIKGVKGELYPCKPDIFAATYEAADAQQDADKVDAETLLLGKILSDWHNRGETGDVDGAWLQELVIEAGLATVNDEGYVLTQRAMELIGSAIDAARAAKGE